jgi:hypothetical protein
MVGVETPTPTAPKPVALRRVAWHALGLVVAALLAWAILRGYRQPDFLLDFVNMRLC